MSKTLMTMLVISLLLLCQCKPDNNSSQQPVNKVDNKAPNAAKATTVEVLLEGLMVLHRKSGDHYEIGILKPEIALNHSFMIDLDGKAIDLRAYPKDKSWVLEVVGSTTAPGPGTHLVEAGHNGRLNDDETNKSDFSWAVDLEGPEFHNRSLTLKPGNLQPIIQLPDGDLSTLYKAPAVERNQGGGAFSDFGFVTETTRLSLNLQPGEKLRLKIAGTNPEVVIAEWPYGPAAYKLKIHNGPNNKLDPGSHFPYYYELFSDVKKEEKYDFRLEDPEVDPKNLYPYPDKSSKLRWLKTLPCGLVILGKRTAPLE